MELEELFKNRVYALIRERNLEKAKDLLERETEEETEDFSNYELLGDIYLEMEEDEKSLESYQKALEIAKNNEEEVGLLPLLYKIKKIKGESLDINIELAKLLIKNGLRKQFENTFFHYFKGLLNSGNKEEGVKFIESIFEDEAIKNEFLFYFLSSFGEGKEFLQKAIEEYEKSGNTEMVNKLSGFSSEEGIDVNKLKELINIEGIEERKLEPQGTLELAELLDNIGSKEEALNEYLSSIYSFIVEKNDLDKCKEIMEKIKKLEVDDERIARVEEFLNAPPSKTKQIKPEEIDEIVKRRIGEVVQEDVESLKKLARVLSRSSLHNEAIGVFENLIQKNVELKDVFEYYLYSLYESGEYEKIIEISKKAPAGKEEVVNFFEAIAHEKLGETNRALEILSEIYERTPDFMDIEDRLRRLKGEEVVEKVTVEKEEEVVIEEAQEVVEEPIEGIKEEALEEIVQTESEKRPKKGLDERITIIY